MSCPLRVERTAYLATRETGCLESSLLSRHQERPCAVVIPSSSRPHFNPNLRTHSSSFVNLSCDMSKNSVEVSQPAGWTFCPSRAVRESQCIHFPSTCRDKSVKHCRNR